MKCYNGIFRALAGYSVIIKKYQQVGVGSGVYELEPPRERDELPPVIFLNAPETFRPKPFMMEQKHVQLEMGYVSGTEMNVLTYE